MLRQGQQVTPFLFSQKRHVRNQEKTWKKEKKKLRFWRRKRWKRLNSPQKQKNPPRFWPEKQRSQNPLWRQSLHQFPERGKRRANQVRKIHQRTLVFWNLLLPVTGQKRLRKIRQQWVSGNDFGKKHLVRLRWWPTVNQWWDHWTNSTIQHQRVILSEHK